MTSVNCDLQTRHNDADTNEQTRKKTKNPTLHAHHYAKGVYRNTGRKAASRLALSHERCHMTILMIPAGTNGEEARIHTKSTYR